MNAGKTLIANFQKLKARLGLCGLSKSPVIEDPPLRSELYSADQMEQHGKILARTHRLAAGRAPDQLLARLADNECVLASVSTLLMAAVSEKRRITPAGEWLLDNFYLIEEQIRTARRHLPKGYSRELPRLDDRPADDRPRVYDIALETIAHGDGRVDIQSLCRFVAAYQTEAVLKLGELWAIPIMLRLAVIENLRRVGVRIATGWSERNLAGTWADQMMETATQDPKSLILVIADMARSNPPMVGAFVAELTRRLQGRGPTLALPLTWIEQRLSETGQTIEQLVQWENQQQAADQVSISNSIGSLRLLGAIDWREFVESMSIVERTLREDPGGVYARMDFATRDRYRHATEQIAKQGPRSEEEVARQAIELAQSGAGSDICRSAGERAEHVGFYLIDQGRAQLERLLQVRLSGVAAWRRKAGRLPLILYLGSISLITAIITASLLTQAFSDGTFDGAWYWSVLPVGFILLLATSQLAVALVNWLATLFVTPHALPRLDFSLGIPASSRTLVVVPTMLNSAAGLEDLVEALEVRFMANRDEHLHFGLLTDFCDAQHESVAEDGPLLQLAQARITELNQKYASNGGRKDIFFLFHRPRLWNPQELIWMGYERKRGKLADLNALLRSGKHAADTAAHNGFSLVVGESTVLSGVKYVITLDTDTQLPRDAARQFVGVMAHPLNYPVFDPALGRIVAGYGILQPCVAVSLPGTNRSRYARLYGGGAGIDPYTRAVSNVYQDVFGEGSFIGKGIYDVDAFEQALAGRFPENRVLSHDLLEGCYARAGLLSDVQLFEDTPARYGDDVSRRYRWIRGDWQLVGWLARTIIGPTASAAHNPQKNPLSMLSQWKLIDNLRRSLVPIALTMLLLSGWTFLGSPEVWTWTVLGILLIPSLCSAILALFRKPAEVLPRQHIAAAAHSAVRHLLQVAMELACLPYEAFFSLDAMSRTAWRMQVTHRRLLEWNPSSEADRQSAQRGNNSLVESFRKMWAAPVIAIGVALHLAVATPEILTVAGIILLLWCAAPAIAWWISRPLSRRKASLTIVQTLFLRTLARRIWSFFENFIGEQDHWLPPDNFQDYPAAVVAHRTSPTNMGLALLANLSAYDFGYILAGQLIERTTQALRTMDSLERHRGHFYNWYDTQTLQPLPPRYISTVDSGNLAGHLLTLRAGLLALADETILPARLFDGLSDTFRIVAEAAEETCGGNNVVAEILTELHKALAFAATKPPTTLATVRSCLERLEAGSAELVTQVLRSDSSPESELSTWVMTLARQCREALDELNFLGPWPILATTAITSSQAMPSLRALARAGNSPAKDRMAAVNRLAQHCGELAGMEYDFLFDAASHLLSIGYNVDERRADPGYYDLLASEARLCTFVAIAQGQLPQESWFSLGRLLTSTSGEAVLLSWSGSMFEYLMPLLVMPTYDQTLLDQTCKAAVARQIEYGQQRGVPWGISESGYNAVDVHFNYQYRAFGVPGLGLKRGLAEDLVVAPYASVLALMVAPEEACQNLQRLAAKGFLGKFGFFEAIDYTPARQRRGQTNTVVQSFMTHHQGMSLLALDYLLQEQPMQRRFESDRLFQAVMLLLQERIPKATALFSHTDQLSDMRSASVVTDTPIRVFSTPDTPLPEVQLLSNGRYHVMISNAGGGYSRWKDLAVTRWREDGTCDNWGAFCYIREMAASGSFWSTTHQPTLKPALSYAAIFSEGRAEFRRRDAVAHDDGHFETYTEIVVSPEDDIELRRVRITNRSRQQRKLEVTSYAEVVLAPAPADALHPAFSNLFVQTEILRDRRAILCTRRPRSRGEQAPWMMHLMAVHGAEIAEVSYETDRLRFIGRSSSSIAPLALRQETALSGSDGSVLDPIIAMRCLLTLEPEQSATIDMVTGMSETRELALGLIHKYQDRPLADRVFELAWTHSQVVLRQLNASEADAQIYARLAGVVIYANDALRADPAVLVKNRRGQSGLWGYAISGDLPIVLLQIGDAANIDLVRQMVQAHAYWRLKGLAVDLVIWNEDHAGYRQQLQEQIMGMITSGIEASVIDRPGGIFVRPADQISSEDRILLQSVARAIITDGRGTLEEQLDQYGAPEPDTTQFIPSRRYRAPPAAENLLAVASDTLAQRDLILGNGLGGFTRDGREYVIVLAPGQQTPAPWVNVLANPNFGSIVSENGSAYTWSENAHEFRLTPWHNEPVGDSSGEAFYLRDEETGHVWSPTPLPVRGALPYVIRHGFGYSVFETSEAGIHTELWVYVAMDAAVKFSVLKVRNASGRARKLSATGYVEWVLGDLQAKSAMHVVSEIAPRSGALYARNPYNQAFADRVAFFDVDDPQRSLSGDRKEFIGRNGTLRNPAAMQHARLSGKVGAGLDPCAAIQTRFELADGQEREIVFRLGVGRNTDDAAKLVQRFRTPLAARSALEAVWLHWNHALGAVQVDTPDPALNVLANGWLVYQTMACRLWARSGYYQSGGAFGFRDQLQDVMALIHAEPGLVRAHLLLCASRQFLEGDVQHWWHPPSGRGVRTHCSDDYLWLPLAVCRYVMSTGDTGVLDESVHFLEGRPVNPDDDSYYDLPVRSTEAGSLYEHCVRAIRHGLQFGVHGLPLIGSGDWNDGMNLVGIHGKGESVWLGFFLCEVLRQFAVLASARGDQIFSDHCQQEEQVLRQNIEQHGWDGEWYRRAYFDDGTPLGSAGNTECRIDSISQSWAVLSRMAETLAGGDTSFARARQAMQAVDARLVRREDALVQLLAPPFDKSSLDPGYIRGYVPGVRENGGQYTHAAIWAAMAFAALGERERAWELLTMINPVNHALSADGIATYMVEPYVVAADVYAVAPHTGRGGWSWYTGSAGWMYRLIVESLLGLRLEGNQLHLVPCLPADWQGFKIHYRYRETVYHLAVTQTRNDAKAACDVRCVSVDGVEQHDKVIVLVDDRCEHSVDISL